MLCTPTPELIWQSFMHNPVHVLEKETAHMHNANMQIEHF